MSKKSKKQKQRAQQNLSLKERLEKHWNAGHWGAFVSLFLRNRQASLATPLAARWRDALYNCLTESLFVEKNAESTAMALSLIREEPEADAALRDCADVAEDFLDARKNGILPALRPPVAESGLPACWAELRRGLAAFVATERPAGRKKAGANDPEALVDRLAKQAESTGRAKTLSPFTTWLKIARSLEDATKDAPCADTFRAVRAIVGLIRELHTPEPPTWRGWGRILLRNIEAVPFHALFREIPPGQTHPAVFGLWEVFCREGGRKYGEEWERSARVLRLAFAEKNHPLKKVFDRLRETKDDSWRLILADIMDGLFDTEQEIYALHAFFVDAFFSELQDTEPEELPRFLTSLDTLTKIGRHWRPNAPWPRFADRVFSEIIFGCPPFLTPLLERVSLPYESLSAVSLVALACQRNGDVQAIRSNAGARLPLRLTPEETVKLSLMMGDLPPSRRALRGIKTLLEGESYMRLLSGWVYRMAVNAKDEAVDGISFTRQVWASLTPDHWAELCTLPPDDPRGCFCRLCADMRPGSLSRDPARVEAFFDALPDDDPFGVVVAGFLLTWPDVDPHFILRLIERAFSAHMNLAHENTRDAEGHWGYLAELVGGLVNREGRKLIANGILDLMQRFETRKKDPRYLRACAMLEKFAERAPTGKGARKAGKTPPGRKTRRSKD